MRTRLLAATAVSLLTLCCAEEPGAAQAQAPGLASAGPPGAFPADGDTVVAEPISYTEEILGSAPANAPLPMIVLLHGKQGRPENIRRAFAGLRGPARVIVPRGAPFGGGGYVWWDLHIKDNDPRAFAVAAREATRRMAGLIRQLVRDRPTLGRPVVSGFSQGAIVAYSLAVLDPDLVSAAFPLSGVLPLGLEPATWPSGTRMPAVHAFHGGQDPIVPLPLDRDSVARLVALGLPATLTVYPSMAHVTEPEEMSVVIPQIEDALRHEAAAPAR